MTGPRLTADFWLGAYRARLNALNIPAFITARGDPTAGAILIKLNLLDGRAIVYARAYGPDGERGWTRLTGESPAPERDADAAITSQRAFDPDLWVIEVEDREGRVELDDPIF